MSIWERRCTGSKQRKSASGSAIILRRRVLQACKPGSVSSRDREGGDHLSSPPNDFEATLGLPGNRWAPALGGTTLPPGSSSQPGDGPGAHGPSIWPCSKWGLAVAASPQTTGRSYRPISPLSFQRMEGRCVSVPLSVPRGASARAWGLPSTLPGGARTFLPGAPAKRGAAAVTQPTSLSKSTLA